MIETAPVTPGEWESFYVIVGSTAGALTGLQFVVLTLITEAGMIRGTGEALSAFSTPNVVHFCAALLVSAVVSAPWHGYGPPGVAVVLVGILGLVYCATVWMRTTRQRDYKPVVEDWIWHIALPIVAYAALVYSGIQFSRASVDAEFGIGGAALLLVFIGIHNAWDTVMYATIERAKAKWDPGDATKRGEPPASPAGP